MLGRWGISLILGGGITNSAGVQGSYYWYLGSLDKARVFRKDLF